MFLLLVFSSRVALPLLYFPILLPWDCSQGNATFLKYSIYTARNKNTELQLLFIFLPAKFTPNIRFWNPPQAPLSSFKCARKISAAKCSMLTQTCFTPLLTAPLHSTGCCTDERLLKLIPKCHHYRWHIIDRHYRPTNASSSLDWLRLPRQICLAALMKTPVFLNFFKVLMKIRFSQFLQGIKATLRRMIFSRNCPQVYAS